MFPIRPNRGFTLVELVVVITVLAILATCILYRSDAPKIGDEPWFDNHVVEEIP